MSFGPKISIKLCEGNGLRWNAFAKHETPYLSTGCGGRFVIEPWVVFPAFSIPVLIASYCTVILFVTPSDFPDRWELPTFELVIVLVFRF